MTIKILATATDVATAVADHVQSALEAIGGPATLGLAGGGTPHASYVELAQRDIAWEDVTMWLSDERWVAHDDPESNVGMVRAALVERVNGQLLAPNFGSGDPATAAEAYENALQSCFIDRGHGPQPDIVLLGIGDDGHTASLFPGTEALNDMTNCYVANWVPSKNTWRLTATFPLLWSASELIFIVTGAGKAETLHQILDEDFPHPAQQAAARARAATWIIDSAAGELLSGSS